MSNIMTLKHGKDGRSGDKYCVFKIGNVSIGETQNSLTEVFAILRAKNPRVAPRDALSVEEFFKEQAADGPMSSLYRES